MAKKSNTDGLDLTTLSGRMAYAVKTKGPKYIADNSSISLSVLNALGAQKSKTSLDFAAEIARVTGFEIKWLALGEGPQMADDDIWQQSSRFTGVQAVDVSQKLDLSFNPEFLATELRAKPDDCRVWVIDYKIKLAPLERDFIVLINTSLTTGSGRYLVDNAGEKSIVDLQINFDGSAIIRTETGNPESDQAISADQLSDLKILGRVIWHGGRS